MKVTLTIGWLGSFALAAIAGLAVTLNAILESFYPARLGAVLALLVLFHLVRNPRFLFCREFALYSLFAGYMIIALCWTADTDLAMNTVEPAVTFVIILILFGALVMYHDFRAVLAGAFYGFLAGAVYYAFSEGFPFMYPADFSYNAIAGMYLFGLFITLAYAWYTRSLVLPLSVGLLLLAHILVTTSIKTNLGIVLGVMAAALAYSRTFVGVLRRYAILLAVLAGVLAFAVASDEALVERVEAGVERVMVGVEVLKARDDVTGYGGFEERTHWISEGLNGWARDPVFGHGVEAFRDRFSITSHMTAIDLLYNYGLIGFVLFYAMLASIAWRLYRARNPALDGLHALIFATLVCYVFISLSGTMHYNTFLAFFIAVSSALLNPRCRAIAQTGVPPRNVR